MALRSPESNKEMNDIRNQNTVRQKPKFKHKQHTHAHLTKQ